MITAECPDCERPAPVDIDGWFWPHACAESVAVVIARDGKFALLRNPRRGVELPGGKIEKNESVVAAAVREVREEVGLTVLDYTLRKLLVREAGGYWCLLFTAEAVGSLGSPTREGEPFWGTRDDLLNGGSFEDHTRAWLPLYDARTTGGTSP